MSHTGSFGWKVSTGEIFWSEETFRIFQYERNDQTHLGPYPQRVHTEDTAAWKRAIKRESREEKDFDHEYRLLMPDGSVKHVRVAARPQRDASGELEFVGAVMDITAAKETEERIGLIIDTVPGLLWRAQTGRLDRLYQPTLVGLHGNDIGTGAGVGLATGISPRRP